MRKSLLFACSLILGTSFASSAQALSLRDSLVERVGYNFGNPSSRSFDGPNQDYVSPFLPLTDGKFYQLMTFDGPLTEQWSLVAEIAGNRNSNTLGVVDSSSNFSSLISGPTSAPSTGSLSLGSGSFTFALYNPVNNFTFFSVDAMNTDQSPHFHGFRVTTAGNVLLPNFSLVAVLPGDLILAIEDLPARSWDWDYNDMVVVMREVPEPASMMLLASGFGALGWRRRRKQLTA